MVDKLQDLTTTFARIMPQEDIEKVLNDSVDKDMLFLGEVGTPTQDHMYKLMNEWVRRIEGWKQKDVEHNGKPTHHSRKFDSIRACTYKEYRYLYVPIEEESYVFRPAYVAFKATTKNKHHILVNDYPYGFENYMKLLHEYYPELMAYFWKTKPKGYIPLDELRVHAQFVAASRSGKTQFARYIFYRLQYHFNFAQMLIDPHGPFAREAYNVHLNLNKERIINIDPSLREGYTVTINPLKLPDKNRRTVAFALGQFVTTLKEICSSDTGSELSFLMEGLIKECVLFLFSRAEANLLDFYKLLSLDQTLLKEAQLYNPVFFGKDFMASSNGTRRAVENRIHSLITSPLLGPMLLGPETIDLEKAMDSGKIIIFNLGALPEMDRIAYGKLLIAQVKSILWKREGRLDKDMKELFLFLDEFPVFINSGAEQILTEFGKYKLSLFLIHQHMDQITSIKGSVLGNTNVKIVGKVNDPETESVMSGRLRISKEEVANIQKYHFYIKAGDKPAYKIKAPDILLTDKSKVLTEQQMEELNDYQIQTYYRPIIDQRSTPTTSFRPDVEP